MDEVGAGNNSRKFSFKVVDSYIALRETEEAMGIQGEARKSVDFKRGSWVLWCTMASPELGRLK